MQRDKEFVPVLIAEPYYARLGILEYIRRERICRVKSPQQAWNDEVRFAQLYSIEHFKRVFFILFFITGRRKGVYALEYDGTRSDRVNADLQGPYSSNDHIQHSQIRIDAIPV